MTIRLTRLPDMQRVVVGVDPSGTSGLEKASSVGIVAAGLGIDGIGYVLADYTCQLGPMGWARRVVECYHTYNGDRIVAEKNFGGAMVESTIRTIDANVPIKLVTASRGKIARAEPVAALYEQGKIRHAGHFPDLEDQMVCMTAEGYVGGSSSSRILDGPKRGDRPTRSTSQSPDRVDALVWAITELMLKKQFPVPDTLGLPYVPGVGYGSSSP